MADSGYLDTVKGLIEQLEIPDVEWQQDEISGRWTARFVLPYSRLQTTLDRLQKALGSESNSRIIVTPVDLVLSRTKLDQPGRLFGTATALTREQLYDDVKNSARLSSNFLLLVVLSTIVAAIGLLKDSVAVLVGAMVIAPFLGPNIALALGTALGDRKLISESLRTNLIGFLFTLLLTLLIGIAWPVSPESVELMARTTVGLEDVALALAAGAAGVLSLTTGLSSVLVGVMVAVALLPPAVAVGLMLASGQWSLAAGAGMLLTVNIVCVNLSANIVFVARGIKPRNWFEKQKARQSSLITILAWLVSLVVLSVIIYLR